MPSMSTIRFDLDRVIQVIQLPAGERLSALARRLACPSAPSTAGQRRGSRAAEPSEVARAAAPA